jgi:hypothetical protein
MSKYILRSGKLQIGKRGQKKEVTGRSPLRRRISALDCSTIEEEGKETVICLYFNFQ